MSKIDTQGWKAFRVGDLFDVVSTKGKNTYGLEDGCDLAYIAASRENNGVNRMIAKDNMADFISKGNCLVFIHIGDAAAGFCHYVRDDFVGMAGKTSCGYLKNHVMTETIGLFLVSVIRNVNEGLYSFGESWTGNRLMDTMLPLPATPDGQPDWAYMDAYMSEVLKKEEVFAEHLASLTAEAVADGHKLDTSGWKAFRIGELFEIRKGRRLTKAAQIEGDTAFIGATMFNNGVTAFIGNNEHVFPGHCLSVCYNGAVGVTFFQKDDFWASDDVNALYSKTAVSDLCLMFMVPLIEQVGKQNFAYVDKWTQELMAVSEIYLPVTSDGQPDWAWMEQYMQQQMNKAEALVEHLDAVWNS